MLQPIPQGEPGEVRESGIPDHDPVPETVEALHLAEERIMEEHQLYQWHLPSKPLAHYVKIYREDFLHPKLDRFGSYQRMGLNKLAKGGAPATGTREYAEFLTAHSLRDPVGSRRFMIDYLDDYRKHGEQGLLFARLDDGQRAGIRRIDSLRRRYRESKDAAMATAVDTVLAEKAA